MIFSPNHQGESQLTLKEVTATLIYYYDVKLLSKMAGIINKGVNVASTIKHLAQDNKAVDYKSMGMILNRARGESEVSNIKKNLPIQLLGWLPEDDLIREFDFQGRSFLDFPDSAGACKTVKQIIQDLQIL